MIPFFKKNEISICNSPEQNSIVDYRNGIKDYFRKELNQANFFLTKSCTQSLELALLSLNLPAGKEVILPSFGFVSIANAVVLNGLKCVFVDCEPLTMNIDTAAVLNAISKDTVAVITINYAGIACDYDILIEACKEKEIYLIEDNAHGIRAKYKDKWLGELGDISTISFDFLKNISCDEGGGLTVNNLSLFPSMEVVYHFGTNRAGFLRGESNFYEWKGKGSNAALAEPLSKILYSQLINSESIVNAFRQKWHFYFESLKSLRDQGKLELAEIPEYSKPNGHMFWIKTRNENERKKLIEYLQGFEIQTAFHYTPLHLSEYGKKEGVFRGEDKYTTSGSNTLLRLPHYLSITPIEQEEVIGRIFDFFNQ